MSTILGTQIILPLAGSPTLFSALRLVAIGAFKPTEALPHQTYLQHSIVSKSFDLFCLVVPHV